MKMSEAEESKALQVANWLTEKAVGGVGPLSSAEDLALEYLNDSNYEDNDKRVDSLINWETSKNFSTGFAAAIAKIYGHDLNEERVKTLILCVIIGQDIKEVCKQAGIKIGTKLTYVAIRKLPGEVLKRINQAVGFRLLTKAGEKGIINLTKLVPVVGGVVGGTFDAVTCRITAKAAREAFRQ